MKQPVTPMRIQATIDVFDYWNRIRGSHTAALRNDIDPSALRHVLANLFILESSAAGGAVFRLAGTRICDLFGKDLRHADFSSLWAQGQNADIARTAAGIMEHRNPAHFNATGYSTAGHHAAFEIVLLPLRTPEDDCRDRAELCSELAQNRTAGIPGLDRSRLIPRHFSLYGNPKATVPLLADAWRGWRKR